MHPIGSITLNDSFSHCIDSARACIRVIDKPKANFSTSSDSYCLGDNIIFHDLSMGDPSSALAYYHWDFGDGTGTSVIGTAEHTYTAAGIYFVTLTVKNECNCTDSFRVKLTIDKTPGPDIICPSIVCAGQTATYSTTASCPTFVWTVTGGTIISGAGTSSITVLWDHVDSTGFGYVSLYTPGCPICSFPSTIKVPVILQNAIISGPHRLCPNKQYTFSLPLWAATRYSWGVLTSPSSITGCRTDNKVIVRFTTPGTYIIHGWYQNEIALCGGDVFDTVIVEPETVIAGLTSVCADPTIIQTYSIPAGYPADWTLADYTGTVLASASGTTSLSYHFITAGTYLLTAGGDFCAEPLTITVHSLPGAIDSVTGNNIVCLNRVYNYKAWNNVPGDFYSWQAIGGTVTPATGSDVVSVIWTSIGPKLLKVRHISSTSPYCEGPETVINVTQELITPNITGDLHPCANSYRNYTANYTRGEVYSWAILPDSVGSVMLGNHSPDITILWNNVVTITTVNVVVTVIKCDSVVRDTVLVTVNPSLPVSIIASSSPDCPGVPITFTATGGGSSYVWNFGDGSPLVTTTSNVSPPHAFPINITTGNVIYSVHVSVLPDASATCPIAGNAAFDMVIKPGPVAYASTAGLFRICPPETKLLLGTITDNVGILTYQWSNHGVAIPGEDEAGMTAYDSGMYSLIVIADNGCTAESNILHLIRHCETPDTGSACGPAIATSTASCNTITLSTATGLSATWTANVQPIGWPSTVFVGNPAVATYDKPGIYGFAIESVSDTCTNFGNKSDTVGIVANFRYSVFCADGGTDSVVLDDYSAYLPFWAITGINWTIDGTPVASGVTLHWSFAAGTTHVITETVSGTKPYGTFSCSKTRSITMPGLPSASFTYSTAPICEAVPINFFGAPGFASYHWNFGDSSNVILQNPQRTYTWRPSLNPIPYHATLFVTDSIGCSADTSMDVNIYHNLLNGSMDFGGAICPDMIPYSAIYLSAPGGFGPFSYTWSNGFSSLVPTLDVSSTGFYLATITDFYQCQFTPTIAENIKIINVPEAVIFGVQHYCIGDVVKLYGNAGTGVSYRWLRDGVLVSTAPELVDPGLAAGHYHYQLEITVTDSATGTPCSRTSPIDDIRIYSLPTPPVVAAPVALNCDQYKILLSATTSVSGTYNWSDGNYGQLDTVYTGGPYRVYFTDLHGCTSHSDVDVPMSPDYYFQYFPSGCYNLCHQQLPLTILGPPCTYLPMAAWVKDGVNVSTSLFSYNITSDGSYQWVINNGLCAKESKPMNVEVSECGNCGDLELHATLDCDVSPASYIANVSFNAPLGSTFIIGTNIGPMAPFAGIMTTPSFSAPLTFTILTPTSLPPTIDIEVQITFPDGTRCFHKETIPLPPCSWVIEKGAHTTVSDTAKSVANMQMQSALMVYPNPTSGDVTVSYDYGNDGLTGRTLAIYDAMGRRMNYNTPLNAHGEWKLNTSAWASGIYIIRMEGDGKALQVQQMVIVH